MDGGIVLSSIIRKTDKYLECPPIPFSLMCFSGHSSTKRLVKTLPRCVSMVFGEASRGLGLCKHDNNVY